MIEHVANLFKALGEPTRLKIVKLLSIQELCVCELVAILDMSQPRISQHLKVLKNAGVIKERKEKQKSFYTLDAMIMSGALPSFTSFMNIDLKELSAFDLERSRIINLENNPAVKECRNGCRPDYTNLLRGI